MFLGLLPIFWLGCLLSWCWVVWAAYIFWRLTLCQLLCIYFLPFWRLSFNLIVSFVDNPIYEVSYMKMKTQHIKICWNAAKAMLRGKFIVLKYFWGISGGSDSKESACNTGDPGLIPESGRSLSGEDPLEKRMVTHSSILAWRTACTEEPGRLQSIRLLLLEKRDSEYLVITYNGKESKKEYMCVCVCVYDYMYKESFCCTPETQHCKLTIFQFF